MQELKMTGEMLAGFLDRTFPQVADQFAIERVEPMFLRLRLRADHRHLRPGGTVSGPSIFGLADVAFYLALLAMIGEKPLAVTTSAAVDFMRKPAAGRDLFGDARILKLGRSLAVGDVLVFSEGMTEPVARASVTYSIPRS